MKRVGTGYKITLVATPGYSTPGGGVNTDKVLFFEYENAVGKKEEVWVEFFVQNPFNVSKEAIVEATAQALDYLEAELKNGKQLRRRYRLRDGQMFPQ